MYAMLAVYPAVLLWLWLTHRRWVILPLALSVPAAGALLDRWLVAPTSPFWEDYLIASIPVAVVTPLALGVLILAQRRGKLQVLDSGEP